MEDWQEKGCCEDSELIACVEEVEKEISQEKTRFPSLQDNDLISLVANAQAKGTQKATRWSVKAFGGKQQTFTICNKAKYQRIKI